MKNRSVGLSLSEQADVYTSYHEDTVCNFIATLDSQITTMPVSEKEARRVLWKIDLIVLPLLVGTTVLAAVDKNIIGNTAVMGILRDTNLTGNEFSWVGSLFFFGYLIFEWPMSFLIQQFPVAKLLSVTVFGWAVLSMCTAATSSFAGLATVRFLSMRQILLLCSEANTLTVGGLESVVYPINSILTVMWWKTSEQPIRTAIWFNTISTAITGIASYGVGLTQVHLAQWKLLFLIMGGVALIWAIILWVFLPDTPVRCWQLTDREKWICIQRVQSNNTGVEETNFKWYQIRELFLDPKTWLLVIFATTQNIPNGAISSFSALIVSGFGFNTLQAILINLPTGIIGTGFQILLSILCAKFEGYRCIFIVLANLVPLTCGVLLWKLPRSDRYGLMAAYLCFWTYFTPYVLSTSLPMANNSGHTKKIFMNALWFISYSLGNILGPQAFRPGDAPHYEGGFVGLVVSMVIATCAIVLYGLLCRSENARRDKVAASDHQESHTTSEAFGDLTDKEKGDFRYTY